ncbi:MAG: hypothetical protein ACI4I9_00730 [Porcipelethomonas sp.]
MQKYYGNKDCYDDIIDLPHHVSETRPRMSQQARAAQFSPFAALTGYDDAVSEAARLTDARLVPDEERAQELNVKFHILKEHLCERPEITVTYFLADEKKRGGKYISVTGNARIIDEYDQTIVFEDGKKIPVSDIFEFEGEIFSDIKND